MKTTRARRVRRAALSAVSAVSVTAAVLAASAGGAVASPASGGANPVVRIDGGLIRGASATGVNSFLGLPYAAPPTGKLRWRPPQPASSWSGVRDATQFGASCPQSTMGNPFLPPGTISEDCLNLNVYTPTPRSGSRPAGTGVDPRRRPRPGRRPQLRRHQARGGRHGRRHDQLPPRRARLPRAPGARLPARRPGRKLRPDGPAGGPALGPAQHRAVRRRPAQRDHRGPVSRRPVGAGPDGLARRPRALPAGDRAERYVRPEPAATGHGRGRGPDVRHGRRLPGPERGVPAQRASQRPGQQIRRRDSRRRRRLGAHPADRNGPGPRAVRPGAGHQRHHP